MRIFALLSMAALAACTPARVSSGGSAATEVASVGGGAGDVGKVIIIGDDVTALKEFFSRWLSPGSYGAANKDTTIWIGQLPEESPLPLPIPKSARILGSMQGPYNALEVLFDVDQPFEEVRQFYRKALTAGGWTVPESASPGGGFVDTPFEVDSYCLDKSDAYLTLSGRDVKGAPAEVHLSLMMPADSTPCNAMAAGQPPDVFALIPALSTPPGVAMRDGSAGSGSGSGGEYAEASANLVTSLSPADLMSHYADQLVAAGWESLSSASTDTSAWSTWLLTDSHAKEWNGMVLIIATPFSPDRDERYALVRVTEKR